MTQASISLLGRIGLFLKRAARALVIACIVLVLILFALHLFAKVRERSPIGADLPANGALVETELGEIFVLSHGVPGDPALLFSHGTGAWSGLWEPTLRAIAPSGVHAMAFDLPPFGFSRPTRGGDYSRAAQAARIIALLETMDQRPIMVAHSISAGPVMEAVMIRPDLVAGVILVAGAVGLNSHLADKSLPAPLRAGPIRSLATSATVSNPLATGVLLRGFMHRTEGATPAAIATLKRPMRRRGFTPGVAAWLPELFVAPIDARSTRPEAWGTLDLPFGMIWGDQDTVTPPAQAEALLALQPGAFLEVLKDVGHIPQLEAPEAFRAALLNMVLHLQAERRALR